MAMYVNIFSFYAN